MRVLCIGTQLPYSFQIQSLGCILYQACAISCRRFTPSFVESDDQICRRLLTTLPAPNQTRHHLPTAQIIGIRFEAHFRHHPHQDHRLPGDMHIIPRYHRFGKDHPHRHLRLIRCDPS